MQDPITLFLLWLFFGGCKGDPISMVPALPGGGALPPGVPPLPLPGGQPGWPGSPINYTPPWPQALPSGLPKFPGSGWEFDEPPPPAVQQRARELLDQLWAEGNGAFRIEQTAGRWIAFQAQIVASGRKGVVAYRQRSSTSSASPGAVALKRRAAPPARAAAPAASRPAPRARAPIPSPPAASSPSSQTSPPAAAKPVSAPSPVGLPVLMKGAGIKPKPPSPNVKLLQERLGLKPVDGQFWTDTEKAVRAFQAAHGLTVDGIVGPETWTALFAVRV